LLVEDVAGARSAELVLDSTPAPPGASARRVELARRLASGVPLQHVIGHWGFRQLDLTVDRRALIPRPETEVVVAVALRELAANRGARTSARALDLGTGSGAIACSLVAECDDLAVVATDRSLEALSLAAENRQRLSPAARERLVLVGADWYAPFGATFDLIVANPPYVSEKEWAGLDPLVADHDPRHAIVAGPDGFECLEQVISGAKGALRRGGALVVELAPAQAERAIALVRRRGARVASVEPDLTGRPRVLAARF
jgi:release factor glutamine methyltransferase